MVNHRIGGLSTLYSKPVNMTRSNRLSTYDVKRIIRLVAAEITFDIIFIDISTNIVRLTE
jgi:hypothetical protein